MRHTNIIRTLRPSSSSSAVTRANVTMGELQMNFGVMPLLILCSSGPETNLRSAFDQAK